MGKSTNRATKYVRLMDNIGWKNKSNWSSASEEEYEREIIPFKEWLRKAVTYIPAKEVYEVTEGYYFLDHSSPAGSKFWVYLEQGRVAVAALYSYQKIGAHG